MIESLVQTLKEVSETVKNLDNPLSRFAKDEVWQNTSSENKESGYKDQYRMDVVNNLDEKTVDALKEAGYPESVIVKISSDAEAKIYLEAGLKPDVINGKDVLVKVDIDLNQEDIFGRSNLERMKSGLAPLDKDGKPYELHHIGQGNDSPLAELTQTEHRGQGNDTILHDKTKESEIDRKGFLKERSDHWKARAEQLESQLQ